MRTFAYPRLIKRVRALLFDSLLLPVAVFSVLMLGSELGVSGVPGKVALVLAPVLALGPGLVALTGGTVGHHLQHIRVTTLDGRRNIGFFAAVIRSFVKLGLGWLSLVFILTTARHQAAHDLAAGSMVIHETTAGLPAHEILAERRLDEVNYRYPQAWKRLLVVALYAAALTALYPLILEVTWTTACLEYNRCTTRDMLVELVLNILWLVTIGWCAVRGWNGMLYGCRRRRRESAH